MPSEVRIRDDGKIETVSLMGVTVLSEDLKLVHNKSQPAIKLKSLETDKSGLLFPNISHYIDPKLKLHWVYIYTGEIVIYDEINQSYRTLYVGYPHNGNSMVKIMPYQDDVLVMLDHQLHRFSREGVWQETIEYPRGEPDGIYVHSPAGENSFVLNDEEGVIYLVQGFRVLRIDLEESSAKPIFEQHYSDIGEISLFKGHLLFSMEGHPVWYPEEHTAYSNELIKISTDTGKFQRYRLESGWVSNGMSAAGADANRELIQSGQLSLLRRLSNNYSDVEFGLLDLEAWEPPAPSIAENGG